MDRCAKPDWYFPPHAAGVAVNKRKFLLFLQIAHKYLAEKNLSPADDTKFKEQLYRIWFELYARRGSSRWVDLSLTPPLESGTTMENLVLCSTSNQHRCDRTKHKIFIARSEWKQTLNNMFCSHCTWLNTIWSFWLRMNLRRLLTASVSHQAGLFRVRTRVCRRDERKADRHRLSQLDPALLTREARTHWLQRLQRQRTFTSGTTSRVNWFK